MGLYYPKERWQELEKKLTVIKNACGFDHTSDCLIWLMKHPINKKQLDILTFHLTIGETYFFRDRQLFTTLEQQILPDIISNHLKDRSIRIWSAACCTGEEPYSIAMLLHRVIPNIKDWKISILGSDINPEFLNKAKKAQYKKWSFRTTSPDNIKHYFTKNKDETFSVIPEIQNMVDFKELNLVDDAYPDSLQGFNEMDLILCHNVLIYFSENQIKTTVHKLTKSLRKNGWLSFSAIETSFIAETDLNPHRYPGIVFFKKKPSPKASHVEHHSPHQHTPLLLKNRNAIFPSTSVDKPHTTPHITKTHAKIKSNDDVFNECLRLSQQKAYQDIITLLKPLLTPFKNDVTAITEHVEEIILLIRTYANQGDLISALEWTERGLQADQLNPVLHYLHATLLQEQGNASEAIKSVKKAIFIDTDFILAYIMLGILEKQQHNKQAAQRNFNTALDLINNLPLENPQYHTDAFAPEYLKDLISNNLKNL